MPCKIQIKQNLQTTVEQKSQGWDKVSFEQVQLLANKINAEFRSAVVSFPKEGVRKINIPNELVDTYYNFENKLEAMEVIDASKNVQLQTDNMRMTPANEGTIARVKMVAEKMGISFMDLQDYLKGNPNISDIGINALADQFQGIVAIAQGMEAQAITEETVHIATSILEQTNPQLITGLIKDIGKFKIYRETLKAYRGKKAYQLANGKPNIRKIKKEAVDKLIAEVIVNEDRNFGDSFPELMQPKIFERIKNWWKGILNSLGASYRETNLDMFQTAASLVMEGVPGGNIKDIENKDIYYQAGNNTAVDNMYNTILEKAKRIKGPIPETAEKKRHYLFEIGGKFKEVAKTVTEKIKEGKQFPDRSPKQKIVDDIKKEWGTEGHNFIEKYIAKNLIDADGYARPTALNNKIESNLPDKMQAALIEFSKELIGSYPEGTRFMVEVKAVNEAIPGMLASTIDFVALEPTTKKDGSPDVKVDILDWKFSSFDENLSGDDIPFYKQKDWKAQMSEYVRMFKNYGATNTTIRKARMIPFKMNYKYFKDKNPEIQSMEIGSLNNLKETKTYLLPVAIDSESTGFAQIDTLLSGLRQQYSKLYEKVVSEDEQQEKNIELNQISKAIRLLQMKHDFEPLLAVTNSFLERAAKLVKTFDKIDYTQLSEEEIRTKLKDLKEAKNSAEKYIEMAAAFKLVMDKTNKKDRQILAELAKLDNKVDGMLKMSTEIQSEYAVQLSIIKGLTTSETAEEVLRPEKKIDKLSRSFLEASKLPSYLIKLGVDMIQRVKNYADLQYNEKMQEFKEVLIPLEKLAQSQNKKAFDLIAKKTSNSLQLIRKLDDKFISQVKDAKASKDTEFFKKNMNMEKYQELLKKTLEENEAKINARTWYPLDEQANQAKKEYEIKRLRNRVDISRKGFNGHDTSHFSYLFYNSINEEQHYSPEFKQLKSQPAAYKAWQFFTELNDTAKELGYLGKKQLSFFPLIEATTVEKMIQADSKLGQVKDSAMDLYSIRTNEMYDFAKIDPETGQIQKNIPKYYTSTDKQINQLSTNLDMVGSMWIKAILDYKSSKNLEYELLTLLDVEKAKNNLAVANGGIVFQGGTPLTEDGSNANADVFETIIDDSVYGIKEDLDSWGARSISAVSGLKSKSSEQTANRSFKVKKGIRSADTLFRSLAIGLKPLIGLANYFGLQFQAFINAGEFYKFREFMGNNARVTGNMLSKEQKALLHYIMPLNEDIVAEKRRQIAKEQGSVMKWLSTWTFTDVMMSTNAFPERLLQYANAVSMNQNSMVVDGKIVNIRQYLKAQDRKSKYNMSASDRKKLEKTFEDRVKKLKETKALDKIVKIEGDKITIPGADLKAVADYRLQITEYGRKLSGLMSENNKMGYRRDTIISSFMMFRSWMPKHVGTRILDINKNLELNQWEYGKTRLFVKTVAMLGFRNITKIKDILAGNEEGVKFMREMLEEKKMSYFNATGKQLTISEEEFFDLVRTELNNQMKELLTLTTIVATVMKVSAMEPPEDATPEEINRYKWWAKLFNKTSDEISFYYNPLSFDAFTQGSIMPSLRLLTKVWRAFNQLYKETKGVYLDDEDIMDGAHPTKYFLNLVPGASQFQNELLPYLYPEVAKELGIRVSAHPFHR